MQPTVFIDKTRSFQLDNLGKTRAISIIHSVRTQSIIPRNKDNQAYLLFTVGGNIRITLDMALFSSGTEAQIGHYISLPPIPDIISEWAGIIPLVVHLASYKDDFTIVGDVCLLGTLPFGLVPRLGTLSGFSKLLVRGREFLEQAAPKGGSSRTVWDVRWGSVFPAANGAASTAVLNLLVCHGKLSPIKMPGVAGYAESGTTSATQSTLTSTMVSSKSSTVTESPSPCPSQPKQASPSVQHRYSRSQHLHVIRYDRSSKSKSLKGDLRRLRLNKGYKICVSIVLAAIASFLCLCGMYGTAAVLVMSSISRLVCLAVRIHRPPDYLLNNENHDAYFLMATHQNALEWYLHIGDRSIVDTILNKPMLEIPINTTNILAARWFRFANLLQLMAMTFTAAHKGWDGIGLILLVALDRIIRWQLSGNALSLSWLEGEGIRVEGKSFEFSGRSMLLGALQLHSKSKVTTWMDGILARHPRREAFLERLRGNEGESTEAVASLDERDQRWIDYATTLSIDCAKTLTKELNTQNV